MLRMNQATSDRETSTSGERLLSRGAIALGVPAAGYLIVYAHEAGFLNTFGIPTALATLDLVTVLQVSLVLVGAMTLFFWVGNLVSMLWPQGRKLTWNHIRIIRDMGTAAAGVALVLLLPNTRSLGFVVLFMGGLFAFLDFVWPLLTQRGKKTYREKLEAVDEIDRNTKTLFDRAIPLLGVRTLRLFLLVGVLAAFAYLCGLYSAQHKVSYLAFQMDDGGEAVVLREYHDRLICAPFDRNARCLEEGFFILETACNSPLLLTLEEVGPLKTRTALTE
jgi:hypothetical protein